MHCPHCDTEHEPDATRCPVCGGELVAGPPPAARDEAEWVELVTVLDTADPSLLLVAKSLLDAEGVASFAEGVGPQESLGAGRIAASDLPLGPGRLRVHPEDAERARELIAGLQPTPDTDDPGA